MVPTRSFCRIGAAVIVTFVIISVTAVSAAWADWQARVVARADDSDPFSVSPIQARLGEPVQLTVVLIDSHGDILADAERVRLRRRAVRPDAPLPDGVAIRWLRVVPRPYHMELPPQNPGDFTFSNNVLLGPDHGDWLGFDTLEYDTQVMLARSGVPEDGRHIVLHEASPSWWRRGNGNDGSNWFSVEVTLPDGSVIRSPDGDAVDRFGLSRDVMRVSYRSGDDFVGWLSTYFNVPHVFGSAGGTDTRHQAEIYVGADCADALVGARRAAGREDAYTSVSGIDRLADDVSDVLILGEDGRFRDVEGNLVELRWGEDVYRGDLLAIDFTLAGPRLPRAWDHIGALLADRSPFGPANGILDGTDLMRHMARAGLADEPLQRRGPIRVRIWRWED